MILKQYCLKQEYLLIKNKIKKKPKKKSKIKKIQKKKANGNKKGANSS